MLSFSALSLPLTPDLAVPRLNGGDAGTSFLALAAVWGGKPATDGLPELAGGGTRLPTVLLPTVPGRDGEARPVALWNPAGVPSIRPPLRVAEIEIAPRVNRPSELTTEEQAEPTDAGALPAQPPQPESADPRAPHAGLPLDAAEPKEAAAADPRPKNLEDVPQAMQEPIGTAVAMPVVAPALVPASSSAIADAPGPQPTSLPPAAVRAKTPTLAQSVAHAAHGPVPTPDAPLARLQRQEGERPRHAPAAPVAPARVEPFPTGIAEAPAGPAASVVVGVASPLRPELEPRAEVHSAAGHSARSEAIAPATVDDTPIAVPASTPEPHRRFGAIITAPRGAPVASPGRAAASTLAARIETDTRPVIQPPARTVAPAPVGEGVQPPVMRPGMPHPLTIEQAFAPSLSAPSPESAAAGPMAALPPDTRPAAIVGDAVPTTILPTPGEPPATVAASPARLAAAGALHRPEPPRSAEAVRQPPAPVDARQAPADRVMPGQDAAPDSLPAVAAPAATIAFPAAVAHAPGRAMPAPAADQAAASDRLAPNARRAERGARIAMPADSSPAPAPGSPSAQPLPAFRAFAAAMFEATRERRAPEPLIVAAAAAPVAIATADAPLDLTQPHWPHAMADRIEWLRDQADVGDRRIRLIPDALGAIDVSLRREGETVHVRFHAEEAQTRQLLADARPELGQLAESRGWKLGDAAPSARSDTGAGGNGGEPARHQPRPSHRPAHTAKPATPDGDAADDRIA